MKEFPIIMLTNGVIIMNFNSPHEFNFEDGSILPAVEESIARATQLSSEDIEKENENPLLIDVTKKFVMSAECKAHLHKAAIIASLSGVDVILVPLPVLLSFKEMEKVPSFVMETLKAKLRTIYVVDRIKKTISINKFCT